MPTGLLEAYRESRARPGRRPDEVRVMAAELKVTQVRSAIGTKPKHARHAARPRAAAASARRNTLPDRPEIRGMIARSRT